ncbi:MAG: FAD-binding protein, partial [Pacificibacter sp.]
MEMPVPNDQILSRKPELVAKLLKALGRDGVIDAPEELKAYECDALSAYRCPPLAAVLPRSTQEVSDIMRICSQMGVPVVPRGAGTSLAGGSMPTADSVILGVARLR